MNTRMPAKKRYESGDKKGRMLRTGEACSILYVSGNTLRRWNKIGIINAYRVGPRGDRRFKLEDVTALLAEARLHSGFVGK